MRSPDVNGGGSGQAEGRARTASPAAAVATRAASVGVVLSWGWMLPGLALAASPLPTTVPAGDPRSSGQGPGLVGDPLTAVLVVAGIAILAVVATLVYVRATGGPSRDRSAR
jgi:2-keto-4-pentenoate hydratase